MDKTRISFIAINKHAAGFFYMSARKHRAISLGGDPEVFGPEVAEEFTLTGDTSEARQGVLAAYWGLAQGVLGPAVPSDPLPASESTFTLLEINLEPHVNLPAWGRVCIVYLRTEWVQGFKVQETPCLFEINDFPDGSEEVLLAEWDSVEQREGITETREAVHAARMVLYEEALAAYEARIAAQEGEGG